MSKSALLQEWAENEMGFHSKSPINWDGLCRGSFFTHWSHLISRVKSKKKVNKLRNNIRLQIHQNSNLADLEKDMEMDEERREKRELLERKKALEEEIQERKRGIWSSREHQIRLEGDIGTLIGTLKAYKREYLDSLKRKAFVEEGFLKEMEEERRKLQDFRSFIRSTQRGILRLNSSEKQFATEKNSIESHGQRAINQGLSPTKKLFPQIILQESNPSEEDLTLLHSQLIIESFQELGAEQILEEFTQSIRHSNSILSQKVERINLKEDAGRIQSELQKKNNGLWSMDSQSNPQGVEGIQSLLSRLTALHVEAGKETATQCEAICEYERKSKGRLRALWKELEGIGDVSDFHRSLIHRNIELEMNSIKLKGTLKKIHESIGEYQRYIQSHSMLKDDFSKLKYTLIAKQADEIKEAQCDISCLIARNQTFSSTLEGLLSSTNDYRTKELKEKTSSDLLRLLKSLENQFMERYNDFNQLPVHFFSFNNIVEPSLPNLHLHNMSIHRFSNQKDLPSPKVMENILSEINLPITSAPGNNFLNHIIDLKRENDFYANWLKINCSNDFYSDLYTIEGMAKELQELKDKTKKEDIPNVQAFMKKFEEFEETFDKLKAELEIWKKEPAQGTIVDDPKFTHKGDTLGKWQEKYRVAFTEWQKHQSKRE